MDGRRGPSARVVGCVLLLWVVVACFGGVVDGAWAGVGLAVAALALTLRPGAPFPLAGPAAAAVGLALLQAAPLPEALLQLLSPWGHGLRLAAGLPGAGPLSVAQEQTLSSAGALAAAAMLCWVAHQISDTRSQRRHLALGVVGVAVGVVALAAVQLARGATHIYFVSARPLTPDHPFFGPFVNANHAATLLACGACLALGVAAADRRENRGRPLALAGAAALLVIATAATGSWGGSLALLLGLAVVGALLGSTGARRGVAQHEVLAGLLAVGAAGALVATGGLVPDALSSPASITSRIVVWRDILSQLLPTSPWVGMGWGSFLYAYPPFKTLPAWTTFEYAHNEWLEVAAEGGLLGIAALAWAVRRALRALKATSQAGARDGALRAGYLGALTVLAAHAVVDFPLHIPALALVGALVLGVLLRWSQDGAPSQDLPPAPRWQAAAVAGLVALSGGYELARAQAAARAEPSLTTHLLEPPPAPPDPAGSEDPLAPVRRPPPEAGASDLDPGALHIAPLPALLRLGDLAFSRSEEDMDHARGHLLRALDLYHAAMLRAPGLDLAWRGEGWTRLYLQDKEGALRCLLRATELAPTDVMGWRMLARFYRLNRQPEAARDVYTIALKAADEPRARWLFEEMWRAWPRTPELAAMLPPTPDHHLWLARWLVPRGRWEEVYDLLQRARELSEGEPSPALLSELAWASLQAGKLDDAQAMLTQLRKASPDDPARIRLEGDVRVASGDITGSVAWYRLALETAPDVGHLARLVEVLGRLERWGEIRREVDQAQRWILPEDRGGWQYGMVVLASARAWHHQGAPERARGGYEEVLTLLPGHEGAVVGLAKLEVESGQTAAAAARLREYTARYPRAHLASAMLAELGASPGTPGEVE